MAYQSRILNEQDKDFFNQFVAGHPKGHLLQTWEWGEVKGE